jgi:hypothetical protein
MNELLVRSLVTLIWILFAGIMGYVGTSSAYEVDRYWTAVPIVIFFVLLTVFVIAAVWQL